MYMFCSGVMIHHLSVVSSWEEHPVIVYLEQFGMLVYNGRLYELLDPKGFQKLHYHLNHDGGSCCLNHQYEMITIRTIDGDGMFPPHIQKVMTICLQQELDATKNPFTNTNPPPYATNYACLERLFLDKTSGLNKHVDIFVVTPALRRLQRWWRRWAKKRRDLRNCAVLMQHILSSKPEELLTKIPEELLMKIQGYVMGV